MTKTDTFQLIVRSSIDDDPFAGPESRYSQELNQFLSVAQAQGGQLVRPRLSMDCAQVQAVVEFVVPLTEYALRILGPALVTWLHGRAGRRIEIHGFGIQIKAAPGAQAQRLIEQFAALQHAYYAKDKA